MIYKYIYLLVGIEYTGEQITTSLVQSISATPTLTPTLTSTLTPTSTLTSTPNLTSTPTSTSFKLPLKRRRTEAGEISVTLNKILESRNLMFNQMNSNRDMHNDIQNINLRLEKVENKLDDVVNSVQETGIQLKLLISAINGANNIVLC